jgi:DNA topoisomerase-3
VFNNGRVTDHHAIIPTSKAPTAALDRDLQRVHDLIVRRFLGAFFPDAEFALTTLTVLVGADAPPPPMPDPAPPRDGVLEALPPAPDRLVARGKVQLAPGWREVAGFDESDDDRGKDGDEEASQRLPPIARGQRLDGAFAPAQKRTRPPPRYTEASILSAMEFAGREVEDEVLRQALKERGLGTPATRASIIETLLRRGYLERQQKSLVPTALGGSLIDLLPARSLASPELTGEWEARLVRMARGEEPRERFMADIATYIREVVAQVRTSAPGAVALPAASAGPAVGPCPLCKAPVSEGFKTFSCSSCAFKLWKQIAGKNISAKLAAVLLRTRRTQTLPGFRSKAGKPFQAALELDDTGQVRLSFNEAPPGTPSRSSQEALPPSPSPPPRKSPLFPLTVQERGPGGEVSPSPPPLPARERGPGGEASPPLPDLRCPRCNEGRMVKGNRAWGCSRWREGCKLVIPFDFGGKKLTEKHLQELVTRGHTSRKASWVVAEQPRKGKLRLDLQTEPPRLVVEDAQ